MRSLLSLTLAAGLVVALAACDTSGPAPTAPEARPSNDGFLVQTTDAAGNSSEHRQERAAVCHYDDETATYELLSVGAPALSAHLERHPDGVPGGEVPEADVPSAFDDDCAVVPVAFTCDAVYGTDGQGRPTLVVTTAAVDPLTVVAGGVARITYGGDRAQQTIFDRSVSATSDNPALRTRGVIATSLPNDDLFKVEVIAGFPDGSRETYACGPYPVIRPDPS